MNLERLGSMYPSRLSFMRALLRRVFEQRWQIHARLFDLDEQGYGTVIYEIKTPQNLYSFVLFSQHLPDAERNDRVIARMWDLTMALCEGAVDEAQLEDLHANVPLQEAGRVDSRVFVLSRANRSMRNFDLIVDQLAAGQQPQPQRLVEVGYLYRTTAVYGSGKLGMADWEKVRTRHVDFDRPFSAEMFVCYLLRQFSLDQVDHLAAQRAPDTAVAMQERIKRYFGIGNATGLGMAPYLIYHPQLINQWLVVRETALAAVLEQGEVNPEKLASLDAMLAKARGYLAETFVEDERQSRLYQTALVELGELREWLVGVAIDNWEVLVTHVGKHYSLETQELLNSVMLELYPSLVDPLVDQLGVVEQMELAPEMPLLDFRILLEDRYSWALAMDFDNPESQAIFWYRSRQKMEPRLGDVGVDAGRDREMPLAIARSVRHCYDLVCQDLEQFPQARVIHFIQRYPAQRAPVRRFQTMAKTHYGDIQANLVAADCLPLHLLRCKLSFFGVGKFDPKSRLWVRNTMFQGAPLVTDIAGPFADDWYFPLAPTATA